MRIEDDVKLDYKDVLFKPKRSKLESRRDVDLTRTIKFHNSGNEWTGIPIIASNMDGVGTFSMAKELQKHKMLTAIHKFYTLEDWKDNIDSLDPNYVSVTVGQSQEDYDLGKQIFELSK